MILKNMMITDNFYKIYSEVAKIPKGKVAAYGDIAKRLGTSARVVGNALHKNPDQMLIPCHRVLNRKGEVAGNFAFGGGKEQRRLLEDEGVIFQKNKVDLSSFGW